jgi:hypothetical protein
MTAAAHALTVAAGHEMTTPGGQTQSTRRLRHGTASGLLMCALWAPMTLIVPDLPDLRSARAIERVTRENTTRLED